jgi:hypothetical protein
LLLDRIAKALSISRTLIDRRAVRIERQIGSKETIDYDCLREFNICLLFNGFQRTDRNHLTAVNRYNRHPSSFRIEQFEM